MGNLSFSKGMTDPPAPARKLPVFAILTVSCTISVTGCWLITKYVNWLYVSVQWREWFRDPNFRANNSLWEALGMHDAAKDVLMLLPYSLVLSLLFALLMIWRWKNMGQPPGLKLILRQSSICAMMIAGALAGFVAYRVFNAIPDPGHVSWPLSVWVEFGIIVSSCLPAGLISGLIAYRYLKLMERSRS